jgi:hypothetical protein
MEVMVYVENDVGVRVSQCSLVSKRKQESLRGVEVQNNDHKNDGLVALGSEWVAEHRFQGLLRRTHRLPVFSFFCRFA